jgi:hypothetical protein
MKRPGPATARGLEILRLWHFLLFSLRVLDSKLAFVKYIATLSLTGGLKHSPQDYAIVSNHTPIRHVLLLSKSLIKSL